MSHAIIEKTQVKFRPFFVKYIPTLSDNAAANKELPFVLWLEQNICVYLSMLMCGQKKALHAAGPHKSYPGVSAI